MNNFLKDVLDQPDSMRKALESILTKENTNKMEEISKLSFDKVLFTGMGSSHFCNYGADIHLVQNGFASFVQSASQMLHYERNLINESSLLILVSQSGESGEIVRLIENIPENIKVVAITNNPNSTLGKRGNYTFLLGVEDEESVSTRTYLSSIILVNLIAKAITGKIKDIDISEIKDSVDKLEQLLKSYIEISEKMKAFIGVPPYICVIGRGASLSSVRAGALFIREVAKFPSIDFDSGEFRHGPFEMVDENFSGIIFAPEGITCGLNCKLAEDIADKGGKVVLVTNRKIKSALKNILVIEIETVNEYLFPILEIVPIQLFANYVAESKNLEVGKFRWSSKICKIE